MHAEVRDLGVGLDPGRLGEVAADLVGPLDPVHRDDVVGGPEQHQREDGVEEDEVDEGPAVHGASSWNAGWAQL